MAYKCKKCGRIYRSLLAMYNHMQNTHRISISRVRKVKAEYVEEISDDSIKTESWNSDDFKKKDAKIAEEFSKTIEKESIVEQVNETIIDPLERESIVEKVNKKWKKE